MPRRRRLPLERYVEGILAGDRVVLARAITLVESDLAADNELAARLLDAILPHSGRVEERAAGPCRPPLLTHVCKRGGRPPSAFRLLPCGQPAGSLLTSA